MELHILGAILELKRKASHHLAGGGSIDYDSAGTLIVSDNETDHEGNINDRVTRHVNKGLLYGAFFCLCCLVYPLLFIPDVIVGLFGNSDGTPDRYLDVGHRMVPG